MLKDILLKIKHKRFLNKYNQKVVRQYISCSHTDKNEERCDYVLAVAAHTIEKGLGCKEKKKEFGVEKAERLCGLLEDYIAKDFNQNKFGFKEAYTVLEAYIDYKNKNNEKIGEIRNRYENIKNQLKVDDMNYRAGGEQVKSDEIKCYNKNEIESFLANSHSIRNYKNEPIKESDIKEAIRIAGYAPSACNRQPNKVYYSMDEKDITEIDKIVPGNSTIKGETPNYLILTTKKTHFGMYEYNQWYVNGGIFASYLRIALHMQNIGNCIYQWPIDGDSEAIRKIYNIPETEEIICIFGIGYYDETSFLIKAQREKL